VNYIFEISLLWFLFGVISWTIGRLLAPKSSPSPKLLNDLRQKNIRMLVKPPMWALRLCGFKANGANILGIPDLQFQLGGIVLILLSGPVGFLASPAALGIGVLFSFFLYYRIPALFINRWPQG
jgi:hypothetical protein